MMRWRYFILFVLSLFCFIPLVFSESCDSDDILRLKYIAEHVDMSYDVSLYTDDEDILYPGDEVYVYNIYFNNLNDDIYGVVKYSNNSFTVSGSNNSFSNFFGGKFSISYYSNSCDTLIMKKDYSFKFFNRFYDNEICNNYKNLYFCDKWGNKIYSENDILKEVKKYELINVNDIDFGYSYYIFGGVLLFVFVSLIIFIIFKRKKRYSL